MVRTIRGENSAWYLTSATEPKQLRFLGHTGRNQYLTSDSRMKYLVMWLGAPYLQDNAKLVSVAGRDQQLFVKPRRWAITTFASCFAGRTGLFRATTELDHPLSQGSLTVRP